MMINKKLMLISRATLLSLCVTTLGYCGLDGPDAKDLPPNQVAPSGPIDIHNAHEFDAHLNALEAFPGQIKEALSHEIHACVNLALAQTAKTGFDLQMHEGLSSEQASAISTTFAQHIKVLSESHARASEARKKILESYGQFKDALGTINESLKQHPLSPQWASALATFEKAKTSMKRVKEAIRTNTEAQLSHMNTLISLDSAEVCLSSLQALGIEPNIEEIRAQLMPLIRLFPDATRYLNQDTAATLNYIFDALKSHSSLKTSWDINLSILKSPIEGEFFSHLNFMEGDFFLFR